MKRKLSTPYHLLSTKRRLFVFAFTIPIILILGVAMFLSLRYASRTQAVWMDDAWAYRTPLTFTHNANVSNTKVKFDIDTATLIAAGKMQSDCGDSRFTDNNGKVLPYYLDAAGGACNTNSTDYYVLIPSIVNSSNLIYHYYGNPNAADGTQGAQFSQATTSPSGGAASSGTEEKGNGPVGYWNLDENTGTTAHSFQNTSATNGTLSNTTWQGEDSCVSVKCLSFNGTTSYVQFNSSGIINTAAGSVSLWVKTTANQTEPSYFIFSHPDGADNSRIYITTNSTGTNLSGLLGNGTVISSNTVTINTWHHVVLTWNSTTAAMYLDGNNVTTTGTFNGLSGTVANFYLGGLSTTSQNFNGSVDELKIYNYARSAAQVKADFAARGGSKGVSTIQGAGASTSSTTGLSTGLIGYWKMDESSWTNDCSTTSVTDSSGNGYNGKACPNSTGPTGASLGKFGNAGLFDGSNDYVDVPDATALNPGTSDFTISFWTNPSAVTSGAAFVGKGFAGNGPGYGMRISGSSPTFWTGDGTNVTEITHSQTLSTSTWYHIVGVRKNGVMSIYVNGVVGSTTGTAAYNITSNGGTPNLNFGARSSGGVAWYNGKLDEMRLYNRALSAQEVRSLYAFAPGPVGYWSLDEKTGTSAGDQSSNGNTGTLTSGPTWIQGKFGSAVKFDGTDDYITIADASILRPGSGSWTVSLWANPANSNQISPLITKRTNSGSFPQYSLWICGDSNCGTSGKKLNAFFMESSGVNDRRAVSTADVADGNWHYFTMVADKSADTVYIYVDGKLTATTTTTTGSWSSLSNTDPLRIGNDNGSNYYAGGIDEIKIYNYARTASQVVEDMNGSHPVGGSPIGSQVSYWNMDEANGTTAHDASVNGNSLTLSSASWNVSGKTNAAWNGVGTNWLSRADDDDLDFAAADDFSLSMWYKSDSASNPGATEYLMYKAPSGASNGGYGIYADTSGHLCFGIDDDNTSFPEDSSCSTNDVYDATWHHLIAVKTGTSQIQIFIDGKPQTADTSISSTGTLANTSTLYVGDKDGTDNGDEFNGDLDEVKVYRSALTTDQIAIEYNGGGGMNFGTTSATEMTNDIGSSNPPLGYWNFDEKTGTSAKDMSGNGRNATLNANFTFDSDSGWTAGKIGSAVHFDGTNDVMQVASSAFGLVGAGDFTVETWVRLDTLPSGSNGRIITYQQGVNDGYHFAIISSANGTCASRFLFEIKKTILGVGTYKASGCSASNTAAVANTWYHLVGVFNGTTDTPTLYVNGVAQVAGSIQSLGLGVLNTLTWASQSTAGSNLIDGIIDETKIYDYGRTQAQISYDYNRGGPLGYWQFDECQGSSANDISGFGYTGTINIGGSGTASVGTCATSSTAWGNGATGKINSSLSLDGTDDYVDVSDTANLRFDSSSQDFSVFAWVKRGATGSEMDIISKEDADNDGWRLEFTSSNTVRCSVNSIDVDSSLTITDTSTWHRVGCVISRAGNGQVYIDGRPTGTATAISSTAMATTAVVRFGARSYSIANYFNGAIDDIRIYPFALSANQVLKGLNGGGGVNFGPATGSP